MSKQPVAVLFTDGTRKNFKNATGFKHDVTHACFFVNINTGNRVMIPDCNVKIIGLMEEVDND